MLLPTPNRRKSVETVSVGEAARRLGVSTDTIRRRISKGELTAHQEPTPQGYRWQVELELDNKAVNHESNLEALVITLQNQVQAQGEELDARRREVQELHVLLQTAQTALTAPNKPWWRRWL